MIGSEFSNWLEMQSLFELKNESLRQSIWSLLWLLLQLKIFLTRRLRTNFDYLTCLTWELTNDLQAEDCFFIAGGSILMEINPRTCLQVLWINSRINSLLCS